MTWRMGWRHLLLAAVVVLLAVATWIGLVGPAVGRERIVAFDVTATIGPDRTVAVREVIDWDFGAALGKHGISRRIPTDGGVPTDVQVSSPTAPDPVEVSRQGTDVSLRIGDPDTTIRGRHRYVITYTLPSAVTGDRRFALDALGAAWPVPMARAQVTILGAELSSPRCFRGDAGSTDRCLVTRVNGGYRSVVDHLDPHEGVTFDGDVASTRPAEVGPLPSFAGRDDGARWRWAALVAALGTLAALVVYLAFRRAGRNEVAGAGATEAAFAPDPGVGPPPPGFSPSAATAAGPAPATRLVADTKMAELAGIDFAPPGGVAPWQAAVVLREAVDDEAVAAWFSSQAARDVVAFTPSGKEVDLTPGPRAASADPTAAPILNRLLGGRGRVTLGSYDKTFAQAWREVAAAIDGWVVSSGVFRRRPPRHVGDRSTMVRYVAIGILGPLVLAAGFVAAVAVGVHTVAVAIALAVVIPALVAVVVYHRLLRSLSPAGSALALRTESFRRFLHDSEAPHVEWAWQNGLLRDYSAWAVALGETGAWNEALRASGVPPAEVTATHSVLAPSVHSSSFSSSHASPSSSGGGGSVGGGVGGGGGGSW